MQYLNLPNMQSSFQIPTYFSEAWSRIHIDRQPKEKDIPFTCHFSTNNKHQRKRESKAKLHEPFSAYIFMLYAEKRRPFKIC
jgi:hypothetical protein